MLTAWRIVRERHVDTAFSGEGASESGGRWNLPGTRVAYASASLSTAALELLVHLNPPCYFKYKAIDLQFEESLVEYLSPDSLPPHWKAEPPTLLTQRLGSRWAADARSAILAVPSSIIPVETNYLLNPMHPDFSRIGIGPAREFAFDPRLL